MTLLDDLHCLKWRLLTLTLLTLTLLLYVTDRKQTGDTGVFNETEEWLIPKEKREEAWRRGALVQDFVCIESLAKPLRIKPKAAIFRQAKWMVRYYAYNVHLMLTNSIYIRLYWENINLYSSMCM